MSSTTSYLLADTHATLLREVSSVTERGDIDETFAFWLVGSSLSRLSINAALDTASKTIGPARTATDVAILGYASTVQELSDEQLVALNSGLSWLVGCDPVVRGTPMPFSMDAVILAGVALGARSGAPELRDRVSLWLGRCREATIAGQGLGEWQEWLLGRVAQYVGFTWQVRADNGSDASEVRLALRSRGLASEQDLDLLKAEEQTVLERLLSDNSTGLGPRRATIRLAALGWIRRQRPVIELRSISANDVGDLLRRVSAGLRKWTWESRPRTRSSVEGRKWHIENEYHVQNLLWLVLAPIFPDLVDEDATEKVGPVQPRADIGIPSLRLLIEAKFMRPNDSPQDAVRQIAEDASLYLVAGSKYDRMIPFIWDDSRRTEHYDDIIRGLRQISGVCDAIVAPRPGMMV